jgi:hypothetical protein
MKKFLKLSLILLCFPQWIFAQTIPVAQALPYSQDFSSLVASSATYPAGWQGWTLSGAGSSSSFRTTAPIADQSLLASSNASTTTGGVHNYAGKIGILSSATVDAALCLSVNTTGKVNVLVTFDISTIRNTFNGTTETRRNNVELQYRVGNTTGAFTSLTGSIYRNNTTAQATITTTPRNGVRFQYVLPAACENQAVVQLRWVQRDSVGAGSRPSFSIDQVIVCPAPVIAATVTPTCGGNSGSIQLNVTAGQSPYTFAWDTINKNGPQFTVTAVTKTSQHPYFGVGFPLGFALDGIQGKELNLTRGINYTFLGTFPGHPFHITTSTAGASFANEIFSGVTNSQLQGGAMVFTPNLSHPALLYYQCGVHLNMGWRVNMNNGQLTTSSINNLSIGSYTVAVKSADGSIATATIVVPAGSPVDLSISGNNQLCTGEDLQLEASGGTSWTWSGPSGFSSAIFDPLVSNIQQSQAGYYTVTASNLSGCTATDSLLVEVNITPQIASIIPDSVMEGEAVTLSGTGFTDVTGMSLNGSSPTPLIVNDSNITFIVPIGTLNGPITLNTLAGCVGVSAGPLVILHLSNLNLKCFAEGFYTTAGQMTNALQDPLNPTAVDTFTVALYDSANVSGPPVHVVSSVLDISGNGVFEFPATVLGNRYYIVVRHRNSIETWSKTTVLFSAETFFDFTQ